MSATARPLTVRRLGHVAYADGLALQERLVAERRAGTVPDTLLLLEHEPVFTLGRSADRGHLLHSAETLAARGYHVFETGRGGDVTYHGPGQVVGYPIVDLSPDRRDVHRYVRDLEEVMIRACGTFGLAAGRVRGLSGCWIGDRKIGAVGVRISRWITSHGFALNVTTASEPYDLIVPCGIHDRGVTSMASELGEAPDIDVVTGALADGFAAVFDRRLA